MRSMTWALRVLLEETAEIDGQFVAPDEYRQIIGLCPDTWNFDAEKKACVQVRSGPKKFRIGDLKPEIRDKIRAAKRGEAHDSKAPSDRGGDSSKKKKVLKLPPNPIMDEATVPPPGGKAYAPDPTRTRQDGTTKAARVGLCGTCVAPPMGIPRLPNLTADEREVEGRFADAFEEDADALVDDYLQRLSKGEIGDAPNVFSTDDAKLLSPDYNPQEEGEEASKEARGRYNVVVHQTANAIAKKAFLRQLDELAKLPKDDPRRSVLVTNGGVASGKGYALGNVEETKALAKQVGGIWDSAGEQNGTESPWVIEEAKKRGLKSILVFVDSDPQETWTNPKRGVVERAKKIGRMVDARVFADSYAIGARNFQALSTKHKNDEDTEFFVLSSREGAPKRVEAVPKVALDADEDEIYESALASIHATPNLPPAVLRGGTISQRIWRPS